VIIDLVGNLLYQFADNMAFLLLSSLGLIIILGVLNIINLAHGELIMIGAYVASMSYYAGVPLWLCFVLSVVTVSLVGVFLERAVISRFYENRTGAMVATWGISLIISQGTLILLGPSMRPIPLPPWKFSIGVYSYSGYRVLLFVVALMLVFVLWVYLYRIRVASSRAPRCRTRKWPRVSASTPSASERWRSRSAPGSPASPGRCMPRRCRSCR